MAVDTVVADPINTQPQDWASRLIAMQKNFEGTQDSYTDPAKQTALAKANMDIGNEFSQNAQRGAQLNLSQKAEAFHEQNATDLMDLARRKQQMEEMLFPTKLGLAGAELANTQAQLTGIQAQGSIATTAAQESSLQAKDAAGLDAFTAVNASKANDPTFWATATPDMAAQYGVRPHTFDDFKQKQVQSATLGLTKNFAQNIKVQDTAAAVDGLARFGEAPPDFSGGQVEYNRQNRMSIGKYQLKQLYDQLPESRQQTLGWFDENGNLSQQVPTGLIFDRHGNLNESKDGPVAQLASLVQQQQKIDLAKARGSSGAINSRLEQNDAAFEAGTISQSVHDANEQQIISNPYSRGMGRTQADVMNKAAFDVLSKRREAAYQAWAKLGEDQQGTPREAALKKQWEDYDVQLDRMANQETPPVQSSAPMVQPVVAPIPQTTSTSTAPQVNAPELPSVSFTPVDPASLVPAAEQEAPKPPITATTPGSEIISRGFDAFMNLSPLPPDQKALTGLPRFNSQADAIKAAQQGKINDGDVVAVYYGTHLKSMAVNVKRNEAAIPQNSFFTQAQANAAVKAGTLKKGDTFYVDGKRGTYNP